MSSFCTLFGGEMEQHVSGDSFYSILNKNTEKSTNKTWIRYYLFRTIDNYGNDWFWTKYNTISITIIRRQIYVLKSKY